MERIPTKPATNWVLQPLQYQGVQLLEGAFQQQFAGALEYFLAIPEDDMLVGFRRRAGQPHPGDELGGWYSNDGSFNIYDYGEIGNAFPQWISFFARAWRITGDPRARDKALRMTNEWEKTIDDDGWHLYSEGGFGIHYSYDKHLASLLDVYEYIGEAHALDIARRITDWAEKSLVRSRLPANAVYYTFTGGDPAHNIQDNEWYTLSESLYRAYLLTGDARYREFAHVWHYDHFWDGLRKNNEDVVTGVHGYSHVNSLSSAAMAYVVEGNKNFLETLQNGYEIFLRSQRLANGGYAPAEHLADNQGSNYYAIEYEPKTFEVCCGSWGVFKAVRYLIGLTGQAKYGEWAEAALYNAIGAALPMKDDSQRRGKTFYYSDLRLGGGRKVYFEHSFPCCSGTYPQAVAEYHNLPYYVGEDGLYISQYLPSTLETDLDGQRVALTLSGQYPREDSFAITLQKGGDFLLALRIPAWLRPGEGEVRLNDEPLSIALEPGQWAKLRYNWQDGDVLQVHFPMHLWLQPIHTTYPRRTALMYGPIMLAAEGKVPQIQGDHTRPVDLAERVEGLHFIAKTSAGEPALFKPYYEYEEKDWCTTYFDLV